jgi:NTP pyrophosphatase (non-canonical NTP hydrolase)
MSVIPDLKTLYEIDDSLWLEETIELLKAKQFEALDLDNLIEELEDLGSEKKFRVASFLQQIIRHSLLLQFWTSERSYNQAHWKSEIVSFKDQLKRYLSTNLRKYLEQEFDNIYEEAVRYVRQKTDNKVNFPDTCPYTLEELLDPNWLPSDNQGENNERNS